MHARRETRDDRKPREPERRIGDGERDERVREDVEDEGDAAEGQVEGDGVV